MNEPVNSRRSLRDDMPMTAKWIDQHRAAWGKPYVDDLLRRAIGKAGAQGEPGLFYALENGRVLGTPFTDYPEIEFWQRYAVVNGAKFAAFIQPPKEAHGKN
jgi:hypothetical protein